MASLGAAVATGPAGLALGATFGGTLLGFAIVGAAGFIDQRFLYPALMGDKTSPRPRRLLDLPTMTLSAGSPRIWAIGRRVRVPMHAFLQSDKVREQNVGGSKGGVANVIRRVTSDVGLVVNDRYTERLTQIIGSGKLLYWTDRNLVNVTTHNMTAADVAGDLVLTMASRDEQDFNDHFEVGQKVRLAGWVANGGPDINVGFWKIAAITPHAATPSTMTLDIYGGQSLTSLAATAGTQAAPASVTRVDDAWVEHSVASALNSPPLGFFTITMNSGAQTEEFARVFSIGDRVQLQGWSAGNGLELEILGISGLQVILRAVGSAIPGGSQTPGSSANAGRVIFWGSQSFPAGMFAVTPGDHYHQGTTTQVPDTIYERHRDPAPAFRGMAYVMLDTFDLSTHFGNQLALMECICEPDPQCTYGDALRIICHRSGIRAEEVDVADVTVRPFDGYYLRGAMPGTIALQPVLVAGQIATQERDDKIAFFDIETADVVQIENGVNFSDLGARAGADTPNQSDKIMRGEFDEGDLATVIGVKHQDRDNVFADGYQPFGLRNPGGTRHQHEEELDLSTMALSRKTARNIATTVLRRTWVNSHTVEVSLPVAYLEVLENDLLTFTDDDENDVMVRVIRRECGANWIVNVVAVREQLDLAVSGSPVQISNEPQHLTPQAALPSTMVLDIPPLLDSERFAPGYYVAAASPRGGQWSGISVYESLDGGTTYTLVETLTAQSGVGVTTTDLDPGDVGEDLSGGPYQDNVNSLTIQLENDGPFPLVSVAEADVVAGANWLYVTNGTDFEILGAIDVTDNGDGEYLLENLIRGLRGTHHSAINNTLAAGSSVCLLTTFHNAGKFRPLQTTDLPATVMVKFVPAGRSLADIDAVTVSIEGWNARPMPVRDVTVDTDGSNNRVFTLHHWSRVNHSIGFTGPWALDEAHEGYRLRIYADDGTTLLRVKHRDAQGTGSSTLSEPTFTYTAAEQTTDDAVENITLGGPHWVEIEQLGDFGINDDSGTQERAGGRTYREQH